MNSQATISKLELDPLLREYLGDCALLERGAAMESVLI